MYTAETVLTRLKEAGTTLVCLKVRDCWPRGYSSSMPAIVRDFSDMVGVDVREWRGPVMPVPTSADISNMEQALSWLALIPNDKYVLRRIVSYRLLTCPNLGRAKLSWRKIAAKIGASHTAVETWHCQGIDLIVRRLNQPGLCSRAGGPVPSVGRVNNVHAGIVARSPARALERA